MTRCGRQPEIADQPEEQVGSAQDQALVEGGLELFLDAREGVIGLAELERSGGVHLTDAIDRAMRRHPISAAHRSLTCPIPAYFLG